LSTSTTAALCNGGNGGATVTPNPFNLGYTYLWQPGGYLFQSSNNIPAGSYTVSVSNSVCASNTVALTIPQGSPAPFSLTYTSTNANCLGQNGSATLTPSGPGVFSFTWAPGGLTTTATAVNGLTPGTYTVNATSNSYCTTQSIVVTVGQNPTNTFSLSGASTNANCTGWGGSATVTPSAPGAFTYTWMPGWYNTPSISNVQSGTYTITVSSPSYCPSQTLAVVIGQNPAVSFSLTSASINASCNGQNGSATVTPSQAGTYSYFWQPGWYNTPTVNTNAGSYTVSVSNNSCTTQTVNVVIGQNPVVTFSLSASVTSANCQGSAGGATVTPSSPGSYTYVWSPGSYSTSAVNNLSAGNYTVSVSNNSCGVQNITFNVAQAPVINFSLAGSSTSVTCPGFSDGTASVTPSSPGTYTYNWQPGGFSVPALFNIPATSYTVVANNGYCGSYTLVVPVGVGPAPVITLNTATINPSCNGFSNGSATVTPSNTTNTTYNWQPGGYTTSVVNSLPAGTYTINVTGGACSTGSTVVTIVDPPRLDLTMDGPVTICDGQSTTLNPIYGGGVPAYTFSWSNGANTPSIMVSPTITTVYTLTLTDSYSCAITLPVTVTVVECTGIAENAHNANANIFPNPVQNELHIETDLVVQSVSVFNAEGKLVLYFQGDEHLVNTSQLSNGIYFVRVNTADGRLLTRKIVVE
jgi:hypothetical protein